MSIYPTGRHSLLNLDGKPVKTKTFDEDLKKNKNKNPIVIDLYHLNVNKIEDVYKHLIEKKFNFALLSSIIFLKKKNTYNCAGIVTYLLKVGEIDELILSNKRIFPFLMGFINSAVCLNVFAQFFKIYYYYGLSRNDIIKVGLLTAGATFSLVTISRSNYKYSTSIAFMSSLTSGALGMISFPSFNMSKAIPLTIKCVRWFGISANFLAKPIVRLIFITRGHWYSVFFLKPFSGISSDSTEDLYINNYIEQARNKAPTLDQKAILYGLIYFKNFLENLSWLGLSLGLIVSACYTSTITTDIIYKKVKITPNDVAQLAKVAQVAENKREKNSKTGYTLKEMLKNIRSPFYSSSSKYETHDANNNRTYNFCRIV